MKCLLKTKKVLKVTDKEVTNFIEKKAQSVKDTNALMTSKKALVEGI
jgi:hypothetical protein